MLREPNASGSSTGWRSGARRGRWARPPRRSATRWVWRMPSAWRPAGHRRTRRRPGPVLVDGNWDFVGLGDHPDRQRRCHLPVDRRRLDPGQGHPDRIMRAEADHYPGYEFDANKGYPCPVTRWPCTPTALRRSTAGPGSSWSTWSGGVPGAGPRPGHGGCPRRKPRWEAPGLSARLPADLADLQELCVSDQR